MPKKGRSSSSKTLTKDAHEAAADHLPPPPSVSRDALPLPALPRWDAVAVANENFLTAASGAELSARGGKAKTGSSANLHAAVSGDRFEDPDGLVPLPAEMAARVARWERPGEYLARVRSEEKARVEAERAALQPDGEDGGEADAAETEDGDGALSTRSGKSGKSRTSEREKGKRRPSDGGGKGGKSSAKGKPGSARSGAGDGEEEADADAPVVAVEREANSETIYHADLGKTAEMRVRQVRRTLTALTAGAAGFDMDFVRSSFRLLADWEAHVEAGDYLWELIYPQNEQGTPQYNPFGKYLVKVWVDGTWRTLTIDDRLPVASDGSLMFVAPASSPLDASTFEFWPLLLCKALCKLARGDSASFGPQPTSVHWLSGLHPRFELLEPATVAYMDGDAAAVHASWEALRALLEQSATPVAASSWAEDDMDADDFDEADDLVDGGLLAGVRQGLVDGLARRCLYTLLDAVDVRVGDDGAEPLRLVRLRCDSGRSYTGPYGDDDVDGWVAEFEEALGVTRQERLEAGARNDFYLTYEAFLGFFTRLHHFADARSASFRETAHELWEDTSVPYCPGEPRLLYTNAAAGDGGAVSGAVNICLAAALPLSGDLATAGDGAAADEDAVLDVYEYAWQTAHVPGPSLLRLATSRVAAATFVPAPGPRVYLLDVKSVRGYALDVASDELVRVRGSSSAEQVSPAEPVPAKGGKKLSAKDAKGAKKGRTSAQPSPVPSPSPSPAPGVDESDPAGAELLQKQADIAARLQAAVEAADAAAADDGDDVAAVEEARAHVRELEAAADEIAYHVEKARGASDAELNVGRMQLGTFADVLPPRHLGHVAELHGAYEIVAPHTWSIWFRRVLRVEQETVLSAQLIPADPAVGAVVRFVLMDNDTGRVVTQRPLQTIPARLAPNKLGYGLMADLRTGTTALAGGKWTLRLFSDVALPAEPVAEEPLVEHVVDGHYDTAQTDDAEFRLFRHVASVPEATWSVSQLVVTREPIVVEPVPDLHERKGKGGSSSKLAIVPPIRTKPGAGGAAENDSVDDDGASAAGATGDEDEETRFAVRVQLLRNEEIIASASGIGLATILGVQLDANVAEPEGKAARKAASKDDKAGGGKPPKGAKGARTGSSASLLTAVSDADASAGEKEAPPRYIVEAVLDAEWYAATGVPVPPLAVLAEARYVWRQLSVHGVTTAPSTEDEDAFAAVCASWEDDGEAGRGAVARETRNAYLVAQGKEPYEGDDAGAAARGGKKGAKGGAKGSTPRAKAAAGKGKKGAKDGAKGKKGKREADDEAPERPTDIAPAEPQIITGDGEDDYVVLSWDDVEREHADAAAAKEDFAGAFATRLADVEQARAETGRVLAAIAEQHEALRRETKDVHAEKWSRREAYRAKQEAARAAELERRREEEAAAAAAAKAAGKAGGKRK